MNLQPYKVFGHHKDKEVYLYTGYGWPMNASIPVISYVHDGTRISSPRATYLINYFGILIDILFALGVLRLVWRICEWLIRRRFKAAPAFSVRTMRD